MKLKKGDIVLFRGTDKVKIIYIYKTLLGGEYRYKVDFLDKDYSYQDIPVREREITAITKLEKALQ